MYIYSIAIHDTNALLLGLHYTNCPVLETFCVECVSLTHLTSIQHCNCLNYFIIILLFLYNTWTISFLLLILLWWKPQVTLSEGCTAMETSSDTQWGQYCHGNLNIIFYALKLLLLQLLVTLLYPIIAEMGVNWSWALIGIQLIRYAKKAGTIQTLGKEKIVWGGCCPCFSRGELLFRPVSSPDERGHRQARDGGTSWDTKRWVFSYSYSVFRGSNSNSKWLTSGWQFKFKISNTQI